MAGALTIAAPLPDPPDIGRRTSRILYGLLMASGFWTYFYRVTEPPGAYWIDQINTLNHVEEILRGRFFMFDRMGSQPGFTYYFTALVWKILPGLNPPATLRVANAILAMLSLALFYSLGRSLKDRRTGLFLMGLGVVSRPMLTKTYWGVDYPALSIAVPLALWATFRVLRRPARDPFIVWVSARLSAST